MKKNFCEKVYEAIQNVPSGKVTTYKEVALHIGTRAYRGVGKALSMNTNAPLIPCHRVVMSDGKIGGYTSPEGLNKKIELLNDEGVKIEDNKVVGFEEVFFKL